MASFESREATLSQRKGNFLAEPVPSISNHNKGNFVIILNGNNNNAQVPAASSAAPLASLAKKNIVILSKNSQSGACPQSVSINAQVPASSATLLASRASTKNFAVLNGNSQIGASQQPTNINNRGITELCNKHDNVRASPTANPSASLVKRKLSLSYRPRLKAPVIAPQIALSQQKQASALLHHRAPEKQPLEEAVLTKVSSCSVAPVSPSFDDIRSEDSDSSTDTVQPLKKRATYTAPNASLNEIDNPVLMSILPPSYEYRLQRIETVDQDNHVVATIRSKLSNKEEAEQWLRDYEEYTLTNFRTEKKKENSSRILFKKRFRCHHNTKASLPSSKTKIPHKKHVNCPAVIIITVKQPNMHRSSDIFLKEYPTVIYLKHVHNHNIRCADALRFRRPYVEMEEKFINMYHRGHSPSSALESLKHDLQEEYGSDYFKVSADRAKCPSAQWAYNIYYRNFGNVYGAPSGPEMLVSLKKFVKEYNESQNSECAAVEEFNGELIIVLCTPFMKRVLTKLKSSGEIMFIDSSGCMDRQNSRVFLMLFPSVAGALPGGVLIISSESEACITRALQLYLTLVPEESFVGRGRSLGPNIVMSDDSKAERNAFQSVFGSAILLLCLFHVLQALWRYIWDSKQKIDKENRPYIFYQFKDCAYATSAEKFDSLFDKMVEDPIVQQHSALLDHLKKLRERAPEWALHQRRGLLTRGHTTNNLSEANIKVIKTTLLHRTKAFNCVQLFDFLTVKYDSYFERRISAVINNRVENYTASRYFVQESQLKPLSSEKISQDVYLVKNTEKGTEYSVDMELEMCSCEAGVGGALCKHLYAVVKTFNLSSSQVLPFADPAAKMNLHQIMTGRQMGEEFFCNLQLSTDGTPQENVAVSAPTFPCDNLSVTNEPTADDCEGDEEQQNLGAENTSDASNSRLLKLQEMVVLLDSKAQCNPNVAKCVDKFLERFFGECTSDSALEHALSTFNRYRGPKPTKNCIQATSGLSEVRRSRNIPVNSISVARRKMPISGRNSRITGRPSKTFRADHQYNRQPSQPAWLMPGSRNISRAPQNLAACVSANVPLGKNCSRKMD